MAQTTGQNLPVPESPFVTPSSGVLSYDGYQYLLSLLNKATTEIQTNSVSTGVVASGVNQATAFLLPSQWNEVDTATSTSNGVLLADYQVGQSQTVFNASGISINVYPQPGSQINALGANVAYSLANGSRVTFDFISSVQIRS